MGFSRDNRDKPRALIRPTFCSRSGWGKAASAAERTNHAVVLCMAGAGNRDRPGGTGRGSSWHASAGGRSLDPSTLDPILHQGRPSTFSRTTSGQRVTFSPRPSAGPGPGRRPDPGGALDRSTPSTRRPAAGPIDQAGTFRRPVPWSGWQSIPCDNGNNWWFPCVKSAMPI